MRLQITRTLSLGLVLIVVSCATAASYHAAYQWSLGGYLEIQGSKNVYWIQFVGSKHLPEEAESVFLEYGCAELAVEYGYSHFYVIPRRPEDHFIDYPMGGPWVWIALTEGSVPDSIDAELVSAATILEELTPLVSKYKKHK